MEKDGNGQDYQSSHSHSADLGPPPMEYADLVVDRHNCHHQPQEMMRAAGHEGDRTSQPNDYMFHQQGQNHLAQPPMVVAPSSQLPQMDAMLSFADVMQFADFGPRLGLTPQSSGGVGAAAAEGMEGCFLRFPVLPGDDVDSPPEDQEHAAVSAPTMQLASSRDGFGQNRGTVSADGGMRNGEGEGSEPLFSVQEHQQLAYKLQVAAETKSSTNNNTNGNGSGGGSNRRKRPRALKTSEEVESQRMTHIAVERNRRKQMNEHLRVLRSLMPGSYVQRGDQASIIGGAIEFVRELEQLLQCLESQKRRRLLGEGAPLLPPAAPVPQQLPPPQPTTAAFLSLPPPPAHDLLPLGSAADDPMKQLLDLDGGSDCREETAANATETAETKTVAADVEVKVAGLDAVIKVLSRRRTGQLLKTIAALEEMRFDVMHTNVTTIDQTVLYSFHVKTTASMTRFSAEEIASSVQHMFGLFDSNAL